MSFNRVWYQYVVGFSMRYTVAQKSKRRLLILSVSMGLISAFAGTLFAIYHYQSSQKYRLMRHDALVAIQAENYEQAIELFYRCLAYKPDDQKLLSHFTTAQIKFGNCSKRHMDLTIDALTRLIQDNPKQTQAAMMLVNLYRSVGDEKQAIAVATNAIKQQPNHVGLLQSKALSHARLGEFAAAVTHVDQCLLLEPNKMDLYLLRLHLMQQMNMPVAQIQQTVNHWEPHLVRPGWFTAFKGLVFRFSADEQQAKARFLQAAKQGNDDAKLISFLVKQFESLGENQLAQKMIDQANSKLDPELLYQKVWRMWVNAKYPQLVTIAHQNVPQVLVLQIMANQYMGKTQKVQSLFAELSAMVVNNSEQVWSHFVGLLVNESYVTPMQIIDVAQQVRSRRTRIDLAEMVLARQWEKMGEYDIALDAWERLANLNRNWELPVIQKARLLLKTGSFEAAAAAARKAVACNPNSLDAAVLLIESLVASSEQGLQTAKLLFYDIRPQLDQQTKIVLSARLLDLQKASEQITTAVKQQQQWTAQTWLELIQISFKRNAQWHSQCLEAYHEQYGKTAQWLAFKARILMRQGKIIEARQLVSTHVNLHTDQRGGQVQWLLVQAQFLSEIADSLTAQLACHQLLDQYPNHIDVAKTILKMAVRPNQKKLREKAIMQLHRLTGDFAVCWRYEQAKFFIDGGLNPSSLLKSATLLHTALKQAPSAIRCRLLLIQCLEYIDSPQGIEEQIKAILQADPYHRVGRKCQRVAS